MDIWDKRLSVFRENKSYCGCVSAREKKLTCSCGEFEYEPSWRWDENVRTTTTTLLSQNGQEVYFHKGYSVGNACVRGDTPFTSGNDYYWEVKILSSVYGTSMMIGIGTKSFNLNQSSHQFCNLLGCDSESWGMKYDGTLYHNQEVYNYNRMAGFTIGSIIGVHLDMWNGTLEFYLNRMPLGVAFTGLKNKILYPFLSSTASHTVMKLTYAHSEPHTLSLISVKYLTQKSLDVLPPGLKSYNKTCWWLFPKSNGLKSEKKLDLMPSLCTIDLLTDSDSDEEEKNQSKTDCNALVHKVKNVFDNSSLVRPEGSGDNSHFHLPQRNLFRIYDINLGLKWIPRRKSNYGQ